MWRMRRCELFTVTSCTQGRVRISAGGRECPYQLLGVCIEAQFALDDGRFLLFLTEDSPYDERLHVYLLSPDRVIDAVEAGVDFASGMLEIHASGAHWIDVGFFQNDLVYRVAVEDRPRFRTGFRLPAGWRYRKIIGLHALSVAIAPAAPRAVRDLTGW
jgi:hypothetical protein